jgi:cell division protein FtsL
MAQAGDARHGAGQYQSKYRKNEKRKRFNQVMMGITAGLVVITMFVHIGQLARIASVSKQIDALKKELDLLEEQHQYLQITLATRQDMDRVRDEATGRLGMIKPSDDKVRYISLDEYRIAD